MNNNELASIFADDSPKKTKKRRNKRTEFEGLSSKNIKDNKWGQSKKAKRKMKKSKGPFKKNVSLLDYNFNIKVREGDKEVERNLKEYCQQTFQKEHEKAFKLKEEDDYGDTEYKLKLVDSSSERLHHLTTQMKFRLEEGNGEAYYNMGYEDDGQSLGLNEYDFLHSLSTLCYLSLHSKSELILNKVKQGQEGKVAELMVRKKIPERVKLELKIMLLGASESGKSTLLGVLLSNKLDDGNGMARMKILNHKHEVLTGVTSSLTYSVC